MCGGCVPWMGLPDSSASPAASRAQNRAERGRSAEDGPGARRLDADHDIADFLPCLDIPVSLDDLIQLIPPVDERLKLSGLDQFLEMPYRRLVELWQGKHDLLATKERSDEYQNQEQQTSLRGEIDPARLQQPPTSAERALADRIEDHVVFLIVLREVLRPVVDDPAGHGRERTVLRNRHIFSVSTERAAES